MFNERFKEPDTLINNVYVKRKTPYRVTFLARSEEGLLVTKQRRVNLFAQQH